MRLLSLLPEECSRTSNFEFINLMFDKNFMDREAVWMIGTFVELVWVEKFQKKRKVKIDHLIGFMKLKYQSKQVSRRPTLEILVNSTNLHLIC